MQKTDFLLVKERTHSLPCYFLNMNKQLIKQYMNYNLWQSMRSATVLSAISLLFCVSCKDDEPEKDSTNPSIVITSPTSESLVKGTVSIQATVEDRAFDKAEVYIDNTLIGEVNTSPIDLSWDSKTTSDGTHVIKIVAFDKEGNEGEGTMTIDVLNKFITISVSDGYINLPNQNIWFFLTDSKGNQFGAKEASNNTELVFETPDNYKKGDLVSIHRFSYRPNGPTLELYSTVTYTGLKPGKYIFQTTTNTGSSSVTSVGNYTVQLSNQSSGLTPATIGDGVGGSISWSSTGPSSNTYTIPLYKNNTDFILTFRSLNSGLVAPVYKKITNASAGETISLDFQTFSPFDTQAISLDETATSISNTVAGIPEPGNANAKAFFINSYSNTGDFTSLNIYHLGDVFPEYRTSLSMSNPTKSMTYFIEGEIPTSFKKIDASFSNFTYSNNILEASLTGNSDVAFFTWSISPVENGVTRNYNWTIYAGGPTISYTIPQFPAAIISKYPTLNGLTVSYLNNGFSSYDQINGYDEFIKYSLLDNALPLSYHYKEFMSMTYKSPASSGRKNTSASLEELNPTK